ncbi:uncharacterized protein [Ptychodera flava]|uniref:uncharacterized protein n=1 Tax=Ptychodera flava TaxID=63121 RepID=UPI00396A9D1B
MLGFEDSFVLPRDEEESQSKAETKLMDDSHNLKDTAEGKLLVQSEPVEIVVSDEIDERVVLAESDIPVPSVVAQSEEVMEEKTEELMEETGSVVTEDATPTDNLSKMSEEIKEDKKEFSESKLDENSELSDSSPVVENQQEQDEFIQIKEADEKEDVEDLLSLSVETEETMSPDPASMLPVLRHSADLGVHKVDEDICKHYEIPLAEQQLEVTYSKENSAMVSQEECEEEFIIISDDTPGVMEISVESEIIPEDVVETEHEVKDDTKTPPDQVSAAPSQDTGLQVNLRRVASKSVEVFQEDVTEVQPEVRHATLPSTEETTRELSEVLSQEPPVLKVSPHLQTASRNVEVLPEDVTEMRQEVTPENIPSSEVSVGKVSEVLSQEPPVLKVSPHLQTASRNVEVLQEDVTEMRQEVTPENIPSSEVSVGKVSEVLSQEPPVLHVYPHPQVASRNVEVLPDDVTEMQQDLTPENIPSTEVPVGGISEAHSQEPPVLHVYPHPQIASKNVEVFPEDITETLQQATPENVPSSETPSHGVGEAVSHEPPVLQVNPLCSVASVTNEDSLAEDSTQTHTEIPGVTIPATQVSLDTVPQGTDQEPPVLQVSPDLTTTSEPDSSVERQAGNESVSPQDPTPERAREAVLQEKPSLQVYTVQEIVQELPVDPVTVEVPESEITDKPSSEADSSASSPAESEPKALISPSQNISPAPTSSEVKPSQASLPNVSSNIDSKSPRESTAHTIHDPVTSTSEHPPSDHSQLSFTSDVPKPPDKVVSSSTPGNSTLPASDGSSEQLTPHLTSVPNQPRPRSSEGLMTDRRVSSPSGDSESQTSGDEASTTSGSFSCSEIPSPVHHAITSIAEIEEPVSETEEDVVTVEVVPEKPTSNGVIESDIMEEERVVIGQEDNSDKTRSHGSESTRS